MHSNLIQYTADISFEGNGWNAFVEGVGRHFDPKEGESIDDFGVVVQGGVFVNDQVELFARYDGVFIDSDYSNGVNDAFHTLGFGGNYYVFAQSRNAFKISADVQYFPEKVSRNAVVTGVTSGTNSPLQFDNRADQFAIRLQVQLVF